MFFEYDSQNWTTLFLNVTPRIDFLSIFVFFKKSQSWTLFNMTQRNEPDFQNLTQRIEPSSQKDSKNWTLKDYLIPTTKPFYDSWKWTFSVFESKKLSLHFQIYDSNYWTFFWTELTELNFLNMTHRIGPSLKNMTHRIWTLLFNMSQRKWFHFWSWLTDYFFFISFYIFESKNNDPFWEIMTLRIELFFHKI